MATADVLSGGPRPSRPRRRWVSVAGAALVALAAVVLAARAAPGHPVTAPDPVAPVPTPAPAGGPGVVAVAVGTRWAYALVAECDPAATGACDYRLHRRSLGGGAWTALSLVTETRTTGGTAPSLVVSGADVVTVLDESTGGRVYSSAGGAGASRHPLARGRQIDAVPPDGVLDSGICLPCHERLLALAPGSGLLQPLRHQPFPGAGVLTYTMRGNTAWAVSTTSDGVTSAVSLDRGRTWRTVPVRGLAPDVDTVTLTVGAHGDAYLLCSTTGTNGTSRLAGVWANPGPRGGWQRLPGPLPRAVRSALVGERGLLVADPGGTVWRLQPTGEFTALPDPGPTRPELIATGPARMLAATLRGRIPDPLVLTSYDEGETWRTERIG